ncbi:MAG: hypothetical protein ACO1PB_07280 [Ramlibacter sp.]
MKPNATTQPREVQEDEEFRTVSHFSILPPANKLAKAAQAERVQALEDLFVRELAAMSARCGFSAEERRAWAMQNVLAADQVEPYIAAWRRAGSAAWKRINALGDNLRRTSADDRDGWEARLACLVRRADTELGRRADPS